MGNTVRILRSTTAGATPSSLVSGQIAVNEADGKIFYRNASGAVTQFSGGAASVVEADTPAQFPSTGLASTLYLARDSRKMYSWTAAGVYVEVAGVSSYDSRWDLFLPAAPTSVVASGASATSCNVTWSAPTVLSQTPLSDYVIQYSTTGTSWTTFSDSVSTATSAVVSGLSSTQSYYFRVAAVNGVGQGAWSSASVPMSPSGDPLWASVSLLIHAEGTGAAFVDSSANALTITASGAATQSTTQKKFGSKSAYFDQSANTYLSIANNSAFDFGSGPFTVEFWYYPTAFTVGGNATSPMAKNGNDNWANAWGFDMDGTTLSFYIGPSPTDAGGSHGMTLNNWYHIAATRDASNVCRLFVNGVQKGSGATVGTNLTNTNALIIGSRQISGSYGYRLLGGYLDDIRLTKACRYAANFSVPTAQFTDG